MRMGLFVTKDGFEIGKELLIKKLNGYVSYVKGEDPFLFPLGYSHSKAIVLHLF